MAATRVYVTARTPGTNLTGPPYGDWSPSESTRDNRGSRRFVFLLPTSATTGGVVGSITSSDNGSLQAIGQTLIAANADGGAVWVTDVLASPVTLSGTLAITLKVSVPNAAAGGAGAYHVYAYASVGDSLTQRAVLINNATDATAWTATETWRTATFTLSGATALAGDRIVVELGATTSPPTAPTGSTLYTLGWGTTNSSLVVQADATNGSTGTGAAWMEFSDTLSFVAAADPPANDACADAIVITELPYSSPYIDNTSSADTNRAVWWTWTPTENARVFFNTWGGNTAVSLDAFQGGCGALTPVASGDSGSSRDAWVGTSQAAIWFEAVAGTNYFLRLTQFSRTSGSTVQLSAKNSGGSVRLNGASAPSALQEGDLWVSCQHLVGYRNGQMFVTQSDFYNQTPTNSSIDYTLLPMDDLNGGTNTSKRLYVALFGPSTPIVEILDLETLNNGEFEIDFIDDPLDYVNHSENPASLIFSEHTPGLPSDILIGYFGDNYSVRGSLSSPNACRVNRISSLHADNQTGAPWADAQAITVDQDVGGSDYIELSNDGSTLYYTSAGTEILRYDLDGAAQLPVFATLPTQGASVPRPGARGLRLLYPYDGTGGLLVAYGNVVYRLDSAGTIIQAYTPSLTAQAQDLDKIELNPNGRSFWVSDQYSCWMFQFDIATGMEYGSFQTHLPPGQLCGFTILGYRGTLAPPDAGTPEPFPIRRLRRSPHVFLNNKRVFLSRLEPYFRAGIGTTSGQGIDAEVMLRVSKDGGNTWGAERILSAGALGRYATRLQAYRFGVARDWVFEVSVSDPSVPWVLVDLFADIEPEAE